jgi:cobalt-zinc-cadmium efflux system outer membrane protein
MPARLWNCAILMIVMVAGTSGTLMPSFAQAKDAMPTFDLDRIIDLALERNPTIAGAQSVIQQNEGTRIQAGAYPNPTVGYQTANGLIRDPSNGDNRIEHNVTVYQPVEYPGMRAARQEAAAAGLAGATVGLEESKLNLIAAVKTAFYDLLLAERTVDLLQQNLEIVQEVARIVRARVRSGEGPQFEAGDDESQECRARETRRIGHVDGGRFGASVQGARRFSVTP